MSREHDWVLSDVRNRAAKLVEEIDAATPSHVAPDDPRHSRSMGVSGLGAWAHSTLVPQDNREPLNPPPPRLLCSQITLRILIVNHIDPAIRAPTDMWVWT